jgi:hypothetical protein
MIKVYQVIPRGLDVLLGHVDENGKVYRGRIGPDEYLGSVDLATGKVYSSRFGPDKEIGRVDQQSGKVYTSRLGPDDYVGTVDEHGRIHRHVPMAVDETIGKVDRFISFAHSAGAMLLLVLPANKVDLPAGADNEGNKESDNTLT